MGGGGGGGGVGVGVGVGWGGGYSAYHDFNAYCGTWYLSGLEKRILCLDICGSSLIILL